jgi:hypothetical protein
MSNLAIKISPILILSAHPIQQPPHHFLQTIGMRENIVEGLDFVFLLGACLRQWRVTGCFAAIHAKGVGFTRRPLAQAGAKERIQFERSLPCFINPSSIGQRTHTI